MKTKATTINNAHWWPFLFFIIEESSKFYMAFNFCLVLWLIWWFSRNMRHLSFPAEILGEIIQLAFLNSVFSKQVPTYAIRSTELINAQIQMSSTLKSIFTTTLMFLTSPCLAYGTQLEIQNYLGFSRNFFAQNVYMVLHHTLNFSVFHSCISCHFFLTTLGLWESYL